MADDKTASPGKAAPRRALRILTKVHVFLHRLSGGRAFNRMGQDEVCEFRGVARGHQQRGHHCQGGQTSTQPQTVFINVKRWLSLFALYLLCVLQRHVPQTIGSKRSDRSRVSLGEKRGTATTTLCECVYIGDRVGCK